MTMRAMLAFMSNNRWVTTAGEGKATLVYKDDCAKAGAASLLGKGTRKVYNIVGSESISIRQIADMISKRSGQKLEYVPATREEYYDYLAALNIPHDMSGDFSKSPHHSAPTMWSITTSQLPMACWMLNQTTSKS